MDGGLNNKNIFIGLIIFLNTFLIFSAINCYIYIDLKQRCGLIAILMFILGCSLVELIYAPQDDIAIVEDAELIPYIDIWNVQHAQIDPQYAAYYNYIWLDWHELEQRIFFILSLRFILVGL